MKQELIVLLKQFLKEFKQDTLMSEDDATLYDFLEWLSNGKG